MTKMQEYYDSLDEEIADFNKHHRTIGETTIMLENNTQLSNEIIFTLLEEFVGLESPKLEWCDWVDLEITTYRHDYELPNSGYTDYKGRFEEEHGIVLPSESKITVFFFPYGDFPERLKHEKDAIQKGYIDNILLLDAVEYLILVLAHEFKHLHQYENWKVCDSKSWKACENDPFRETDADAYAIRKVREYRHLYNNLPKYHNLEMQEQ